LDRVESLGAAVARHIDLHVVRMHARETFDVLGGICGGRRPEKHRIERNIEMTIERGLRLVAGTIVLACVFLAWLHSPYWLAMLAFVGANLFQSAFTNWCPMVWLLGRLGLRPCEARPR
jgi:hypothetical protein